MRYFMAFAAVSMLTLSAIHAKEFDLGTVELSGSGSIMSTSNDNTSETQFLLQPEAAVYLARFLNIGPVLDWGLYYAKSKSSSSSSTSGGLDLGGKIGFLVPWSDGFGRPLPFFDLGLAASRTSYDYGVTYGSHSKWGGLLLGKAGIKLKIGECFYLALFEQYSRRSLSSYENQFTTGFGFSGLIGS